MPLSNLPPPEIIEFSPPLIPTPLTVFTYIDSTLLSHNISSSTSPYFLLLLGLLIRSFLSNIFPNWLASSVIMTITFYVFLGWKESRDMKEKELMGVKSEQTKLGE